MFGPTISIYLGKRIVDCGYYRNYSGQDILLECCRLARRLDGCKSRREVAEKLGRTYSFERWERGGLHARIMSYPGYPESEKLYVSRIAERLRSFDASVSYCEDRSLLLDIESKSQFPAFIDLTDRCLYWNPGGFIRNPGGDPVRSIRIYEDAFRTDDGWLYGGRISFDLINHICRKFGWDRPNGRGHAGGTKKRIA